MTSPGSVGFVGLGAMGEPMSRRLVAQFAEVFVYDVNGPALQRMVDAGATPCDTPAEVARRAQVVGVSLPSPEVVIDVVRGADGLLTGGGMRTFIDFSTSGPSVARELGPALSAAGVGYVDAPVSGGVPAAQTGRLSVMIAGEPAAVDAARPVLEAVGSTLVPVSSVPGHGQMAKVANNVLSATALAATAEVLTLAVRAGLEVEPLLDFINASSGRNTATADKFPKYVLTRSFDFGFRLDLMVKDIDLCLAEAKQSGTPMILGAAVQQLWRAAASTLEPGCDSTAIAQLFEGWAGVTLQGSGHE